ncbi:MAG: hypothetical protein K9H14_06570 [Actinomycetia bacterium]|nr:hypothetical protein [Actinomycetes bacterium]
MVSLNVSKYRKSAEEFLSRMDKEYYLHFSGRKENLELDQIFAEYGWLFTYQNMEDLQQIQKQQKGENKKRYAYLLKFCAENLIEKQVQHIRQEIANDEAQIQVKVEGNQVPFRFLDVMLANEPVKQKRDKIEQVKNEKIAEILNDNLRLYWKQSHQQARHLGFKSYSLLFSSLKGEDFNHTLEGMKKLLDQTQDVYRKHFGNLVYTRLGITLDQSSRSDFAYVKRGKEYDPYFKQDYMIDAFSETLLGLDIDIYQQKNIIFDIERRKNKSPRAFCSTVRIPEEIYLVVMPSGGQDDFEAFFHEGGHAQHFAHTSCTQPFEFKFLGDNAVTEGFAFLLESLMQNRWWLMDFIKMSPDAADQFCYFSNLLKLWYCRRYAGKLEYELLLHDGSPIAGREKDYCQILGRACNMSYSPQSYMTDVDPGFYCTNYIRAWSFEAQLNQYLCTEYGNRWYSNRRAGNFLKEVWSYGQKYDAAEILEQLGFKQLDTDLLIDSLLSSVKSYKRL